jgi:hypothetical protein
MGESGGAIVTVKLGRKRKEAEGKAKHNERDKAKVLTRCLAFDKVPFGKTLRLQTKL